MYDIKWIRENPELFDRALKRRGLEALSAQVLEMDKKKSFLASFLGVILASIIMMIVSFGLISRVIS